MKFLKSLLVLAAVISLSVSCKDTSATDAAREVPASATPTSTTQAPPAEPAETVPVGPLTSISYAETEFDFGEIEEGEKIVHEFTFTNTGDEPLVISKAVGSCGCTVPDWPREPIPAGQSGTIKVQYDSRGKGKTKAEGGRAENKRVTITANTDPANTYLYVKGKVWKADDAPAS